MAIFHHSVSANDLWCVTAMPNVISIKLNLCLKTCVKIAVDPVSFFEFATRVLIMHSVLWLDRDKQQWRFKQCSLLPNARGSLHYFNLQGRPISLHADRDPSTPL